jgi:alkanesulfonate monooxygenase SsuD/methylene tetrahydromethanopterin reductase-like flavin-dependent oxidoreductase (luciferase family)
MCLWSQGSGRAASRRGICASEGTVFNGGSNLKVHLQLEGSPGKVSNDARDLAALGADGVFTFEGQHDALFSLLVAAAGTDLDLMTTVAIAGRPSPLHLAHAAYHLQIYSPDLVSALRGVPAR